MLELGYDKYVLQGGDWGGEIAPKVASTYPENVLGMHLNYFPVHPEPRKEKLAEAKTYTEFEQNSLNRFREWKKNGTAYVEIQQSKPLTLGVGLHDSPMGLCAWVADKILDWSDSFPRNSKGYIWTNEEFITWTLIQYFGVAGPAGPFQMYAANRFEAEVEELEGNERKYIEVPTGVSALRWENEMVPKRWADKEAKVVWWREHERGGHFALYEMPDEMVQDMVDFVDSLNIRGDSGSIL